MKKSILVLPILLICLLSCSSKNKSHQNKEKKLFYFNSSEAQEIGLGNVIIALDMCVIEIKGDSLKGLYQRGRQNIQEFYLKGKKTGAFYMGDIISLNDNKPQGEFCLKIEENKELRIIGDLPEGAKSIKQENLTYDFSYGSDIYETPDINSKLVDINKEKLEIIEFGNLVKQSDSYNLWYKVKSDNIEGWVFGELNVTSDY